MSFSIFTWVFHKEWPILYLLYTADLPVLHSVTVSTCVDETVILAVHKSPVVATEILQNYLNNFQTWLYTRRMKVNEINTQHISLSEENCPPWLLNNVVVIPTEDNMKYLRIHNDCWLTWKTYIKDNNWTYHLEWWFGF